MLRRRDRKRSLLLLWTLLLGTLCFAGLRTAQADVRLPSVFSDHMVLQQKEPIRVWGWADPGENVAVTLGTQTANATLDASGRWEVELQAQDANTTPQTLTVKGKNELQVKDVLIGEVWLCSGQSNMEWTVDRSSNAAAEIAAADYPLIREINIPKTPEFRPRPDVPASWKVCSPETVGGFTACGYFMARHLHTELDVPIGLINSSWGGTRVEPWTPPIGFKRVDALTDLYESIIGRTPGTEPYEKRLNAHIDVLNAWLQDAKQAVANDTVVQPNPTFPSELVPYTSHQDPTMLYNGMIYPVLGYPIRGAIWYQGESNHDEGMLYFEKKKALIGGWREVWNQGDFPFYYVQIAPYQYGNEDPTILPVFWEAQAAVQQVPNTGMVVINDIATINDIHPPGKQEVGKRLAMLALKNDYGRTDLVANSPEMESLEVGGDHLRITFKNTGGGLKTRDGKAPSLFEVIGPGSSGFQPATAEIDGDAVVLRSPQVQMPTAFRFAWNKTAEPNLVGGTGLPVGAFRGGQVPSFVDTLPINDEYQLVYDLDLSKLGEQIRYDVNRSDEIKSFDRIGYLVELSRSGGETDSLFVTMKAFTDDVTKIAIPTVASGANFQRGVENLDIYSNVKGIVTGKSLPHGNIEFWPNNYGPTNTANVKNAAGNVYDFGDSPSDPAGGYGCMQVHNFAAKQTLFAINHWRAATKADLGIGNSSAETKDWTFTANADSYSAKRLRVYVSK